MSPRKISCTLVNNLQCPLGSDRGSNRDIYGKICFSAWPVGNLLSLFLYMSSSCGSRYLTIVIDFMNLVDFIFLSCSQWLLLQCVKWTPINDGICPFGSSSDSSTQPLLGGVSPAISPKMKALPQFSEELLFFYLFGSGRSLYIDFLVFF